MTALDPERSPGRMAWLLALYAAASLVHFAHNADSALSGSSYMSQSCLCAACGVVSRRLGSQETS